MVLSLVELSLRAILNGIEKRTIRHPHLLPPNLRELVLDTAIKHNLSDRWNDLAVLTSVEFLNGMKSISAKAGTCFELKFLEQLTTSLATKLPNGETVGAGIRKLNLKIPEQHDDYWRKNESVVYRLMAQCPNTKSLALRITNNEYSARPGYWLLDENDVSIRFMENLVELSLSSWTPTNGFNIGRPVIINFNRLTTLKLDHCSLTDDQWFEFLKSVPLLENLHLIDFRCTGNWQEKKMDWMLPFPLANLKWLEIIGDLEIFECNKAFIDNLIGCPKLGKVHLTMDQKSTDEECLVRLVNMEIDLKMKIRIAMDGDDADTNAAIFDSSSRFKLVNIFRERMESFELYVWNEWDPHISTALEDVVGTCSNLTYFAIRPPNIDCDRRPLDIESEGERTKRINETLVQFFGTQERVLHLKDLCMTGKFDEAVMSAVFKNCLNLDRLDIACCPNLRDHHLIDWVSRGGGKLKKLAINFCGDNVTSEGVIPILAMSAESLLRISFLGNADGGRNWIKVMRNRCPNANMFYDD